MGLTHARKLESELKKMLPTLKVGGQLITDIDIESQKKLSKLKNLKIGQNEFLVTQKQHYSFGKKDPLFGVLLIKRIK